MTKLWRRLTSFLGLAWIGMAEHAEYFFSPFRMFWHRFRIGQLWLMKVLMAPMFLAFGASLLLDPSAFNSSPAYFIVRAWASAPAWGVVAVSFAIVMFTVPENNRYVLRLLFFFASLYWGCIAFTVSAANGFSGYTGILTILSLYCGLIMARARVEDDTLEAATDV